MPHLDRAVEAGDAVIVTYLFDYTPPDALDHVHDVFDGEFPADLAEDAGEAAENAWVEASLTHPSWEARASSALVASLAARMIDFGEPEEALGAILSALGARDEPDGRVRAVLRPLDDYAHDPGGWTVYTTRLALLCLLDAWDFRSGVEAAVRLGGDADTNAAVADAPLGARFGAGDIPSSWLQDLKGKEELLALL